MRLIIGSIGSSLISFLTAPCVCVNKTIFLWEYQEFLSEHLSAFWSSPFVCDFFFKLTVFAIPFYNFNFLFCSICARGSYYLSLVIGWGQVSLGLSCLLTLRVGAGQGERMDSMGIFNIGIFQTSLPHLLRYPLHEHISVTFPVLFLFVFWEIFFFPPNRIQDYL